ncbi:MAG: VWA domain-containing protein [Oscillospiraceae bacterium]|nr:VWA domain-containing protein [Oscillospiraceae bacterium]
MNEKNNITEMVFILDRSGSMGGLESDTIGGFNAMIGNQKKEEGKAYVTTVLFDNEYEVLHDRLELSEVPQMTDKDYTVRGCTALLDAVGKTIRHISDVHRYIRAEDVPAHTIFVITTDGLENASHEFSYSEIKELIGAKKKEGWEFLFIGANIDAAEEAARMGIQRENAANYVADGIGTAAVFHAVSATTGFLRRNGKINQGWQTSIEADNKRRSK